MRAAFLEKENGALRAQLKEVTLEKQKLAAEKKLALEKLKRYEGGEAAPSPPSMIGGGVKFE